jgi:hypothetical protein
MRGKRGSRVRGRGFPSTLVSSARECIRSIEVKDEVYGPSVHSHRLQTVQRRGVARLGNARRSGEAT